MKYLNKIHYYLIFILMLLLLLWPFKLIYQLTISIVLLLLDLIIFIFIRKTIKLDKLDIVLGIFPLLNLLILIFKLNVLPFNLNLTNLIIESSIIYSCLILRRTILKDNNIVLLLELLSVFYMLVGILCVSLSNDLILINISSYFGDTYINSIDRFYGTLNYPNASGLIGVLGAISSLYLISNDDSNKYLHLFCFNITIMLFLFTFSKMMTIDLIIVLFIYILYLIIYKNNKEISNVINSIISVIIPSLISISLFRSYLINHNVLLFLIEIIVLIIISFIIYYIFSKINKFIKTIIFIVLITIIVYLTIKPISKPLEISNVKDSNNYYIADFYLEDNTEYTISIDYENRKNEKIYLVEYYLNGLIPTDRKVKVFTNNTITFNTKDNFEYYMIYIEGIDKYTNLKINSIDINGKKVYLDYKFIPYQIIHQLELLKYDKESVTHRFWYYNDCLKYIKDNGYLVGHGYNSFKYYSYGNSRYLEDTPHSYPLQLWIDYGIYGLFLYIFIIIYGLSNIILYRKNKDNLIYSLLFISLMMFSVFDATFDRKIFILLMYILISIISKYKEEKSNNVMFISSAGGHFTELIRLKKLFKNYNYVIITEKNSVSLKFKNKYNIRYLKYGARYYPLQYPLVCIINLFKSIYYFYKYNPSVIVSTGAHSCVLMSYLGFIHNKKIIYLEVFDRIDNPTLTGYMIYPISTIFYVQHKEMLKIFKKAKYLEGVY